LEERSQGAGGVCEDRLYAGAVEGPWYQPMIIAPGVDQVAGNLAKGGVVDLIDGGNMTPKPSLAQGVPMICVSHTPMEPLVFNGQRNFAPITDMPFLRVLGGFARGRYCAVYHA
jgi:hypothetical protein